MSPSSVMDREHPYVFLEIPPEVPFELKPAGEKGWGGFATRFIARNSLIYQEPALFTLHLTMTQQVNDSAVLQAVKNLSKNDKQKFNLLHEASILQGNDNVSELFITNYFALAIPSHKHRELYQPNLLGFFVFISRLNHSCVANAYVPQNMRKTISCYAARDIQPGEEITFSYCGEFPNMCRDRRHGLLDFICHCPACVPGTRFYELSEMRRQLIRGLHYLLLGLDLASSRRGGPSMIITDPELRDNAEKLNIPLMSRLFYESMVGLMLEEEGIMNGLTSEYITNRMSQMAEYLAEKSNVLAARKIMEQDRWMDRWLLASRTFGVRDRGDWDACATLQLIRAANRP
ncbi:hypothetical protein POX_a00218 [Penicillium oxalicum]|uniref:hypothetical protein n=1 Tax=Penicillium oxalicum TaxID=69781 RepID=UPI0020B8C8D5|nr:hypothetical protein POX_a00218 [Penicillium oxalicum]KAI2793635.1 hypothetical protein POX_a00218 [Penicillium oxalicum]